MSSKMKDLQSKGWWYWECGHWRIRSS
jgi:hypothetical protein